MTKGLKFLELGIPQVPHVAAMLQHGATILDVDCGGGTFMITLARVYPSCEFVGIDSDSHTVRLTDYEVTSAEVSERIQVQHGKAEEIAFTERFDLITMNSVLRAVDSHLQPWVLARRFTALKPGGTVLITNFTLPDALRDLRDPARTADVADAGWIRQREESAAGRQRIYAIVR
jgi:S-adenosylmethionine-diacylgycerolhomoserine-N-methlytransferase